METIKEKIERIEPITRKEAKYYTKSCKYCKEFYESKKPLFLLYTRDINQDDINDFSNNYHIFDIEGLNERINYIQKENGVKC